MPLLTTTIKTLPERARVLDFGCFGWTLHELAQKIRPDLQHHACDTLQPKQIPEDVTFYQVASSARHIPCEDDFFDLIVLSHVLEHVADPMELFQESGRVLKPGGKLYVETPSDRSCLVKSDAQVSAHGFFSFWDDPTHLRPWSPAALYRLGIFYGFKPLSTAYIGSIGDVICYPARWVCSHLTRNRHALTEALWKAKKWSAHALFEKPHDFTGKPECVYLSLKNIPAGVDHALTLRSSLLSARPKDFYNRS